MISIGRGNDFNLVAMGDSQTAARVGVTTTAQTYVALIARNLGYANFVNDGVAGNTTTQMLARFSTALVPKAGALSIMGGPNDMTTNVSGGIWVGSGITVATTKANVKSMVEQAQALRCRVTLCSFIPLLFEPYLSNASPYLTAFSEIASETGCEYCDVYAAFMALSSPARVALYVASENPDYQHPNAEGHAFVASLAVGNYFRQVAA